MPADQALNQNAAPGFPPDPETARRSAVRHRRCESGTDGANGLVSVPTGELSMGDSFGDLGADEAPVHTATVSAFYRDRTEVSKGSWDIVYSWATNNAYRFAANVGAGKAPAHPVQTVNWYDAVKWCNAGSPRAATLMEEKTGEEELRIGPGTAVTAAPVAAAPHARASARLRQTPAIPSPRCCGGRSVRKRTSARWPRRNSVPRDETRSPRRRGRA